MELIVNETSFYFAKKQLKKCGYLRDLLETFGEKIESFLHTKAEVEALYEILYEWREPRLDELLFLDSLCVEPPVYACCLRKAYADFVYLIGEHTGMIPRIDQLDMEHVEIEELKVLYSEHYTFVLQVMAMAPFFAEFECPLSDEHLSLSCSSSLEEEDLTYKHYPAERVLRFLDAITDSDFESNY